MVAKKQDPRVSAKYKAVRLRVLNAASWSCFYCGQDATQVDHVVPVSKMGDAIDADNMVASCARCNNAKGSQSQAVFLKRRSTHPDPAKRLSPSPIMTSMTHAGPCLGQPEQGATG